MNIKTIGHNFEHNLWLVASLFFDNSEPAGITSTAHHTNDMITADTAIEWDGALYHGSYRFPCAETGDAYAQRRTCAAVCGMSFYIAARQIRPKQLPWGVMTGIRPAKPMRQMLSEEMPEEAVADYFKHLYGVTDKKLALAMTVAKNELTLLNENMPQDIGLYIGIPFCPTRCLYCSFISSDLRYTKKYVDEYCDLLSREIAYAASLLKKTNLRIQSIYIGGGTPTSLPDDRLDRLVKSITDHFDLAYVKEFCVEAGRPDTITKEKLSILKQAGVNRLSINPQTMNAATLQHIGRNHTPDDINDAFMLARDAGFGNINADLIAGLPGEDEAMFTHTLNAISALSPENITVHTMSVKRGSALNQNKESFTLSADDAVQNMLDIAHDFLAPGGYSPYYLYRQKHMLGNLENTGYSKAGYMSVYNVNIMEEVQSILALGSGASSKSVDIRSNRIERVYNFKSPIEYIKRFDEILTKKDAFFHIIQGKEC